MTVYDFGAIASLVILAGGACVVLLADLDRKSVV